MGRINKRRIRLTAMYSGELQPNSNTLEIVCNNSLMLRSARKVGDEEVVNNFVLGKLKDAKSWGWLDFEIID